MSINRDKYFEILNTTTQYNARLVAVSKLQPKSSIIELHQLKQIAFGENYIQELCEKVNELPKSIEWHLIGHIQTNKIKSIPNSVALIHSIDSLKLLNAINKYAIQTGINFNVLLQCHIATEESKFGMNEEEILGIMQSKENQNFSNITIKGLMGMGSLTDKSKQLEKEYKLLYSIYKKIKETNDSISILSMGMTSDYKIALDQGSNLIRVGSAIFGERKKTI